MSQWTNTMDIGDAGLGGATAAGVDRAGAGSRGARSGGADAGGTGFGGADAGGAGSRGAYAGGTGSGGADAGGTCSVGTDAGGAGAGIADVGGVRINDRYKQFEMEFLATTAPHLYAVLLVLEGDPDVFDILTHCTYTEAVSGEWATQSIATIKEEMASLRFTCTYVDAVPPPWANIVDGMWIFKVKRPPGSQPVFKAWYVPRGSNHREGVLLHIAAQCDYELHSLEFFTAFLLGTLHEQIWLRHLLGFTGSLPPGT
ncbi:unnamed protein product [Closterium sp. NIES-53]